MIVFDAFTSNMQFLIVSYIHNTRMEILPDDKDKLWMLIFTKHKTCLIIVCWIKVEKKWNALETNLDNTKIRYKWFEKKDHIKVK